MLSPSLAFSIQCDALGCNAIYDMYVIVKRHSSLLNKKVKRYSSILHEIAENILEALNREDGTIIYVGT